LQGWYGVAAAPPEPPPPEAELDVEPPVPPAPALPPLDEEDDCAEVEAPAAPDPVAPAPPSPPVPAPLDALLDVVAAALELGPAASSESVEHDATVIHVSDPIHIACARTEREDKPSMQRR
jgi:hypothetical protein